VRTTGFTLAGAMLVALFVMAPLATAAPTPVAEGLFDPRGIADAPGDRLLVAESGSGTITLIRDADGRNPRTSIFAELPDSGLVDVAAAGLGRAYAVAGGAPEFGEGPFGQLLRVRRGGEPTVLADIAAYQETDPDPDNQAESPTQSNANGLAVLGGGRFLVTDAANNDLLLVDDGEITTVARFKPEAVPWPAGLPLSEFPEQPPVGTPVLAEAVPTAVAVGPDGNWYVSELKGFPFHPGSSRIWRIKRGAESATCDPEQPNRACRTVETGFTSVIDLAFGDDGELYVLEIAKAGLLAVEFLNAPPIGGLWRVEDGSKTELEPDELMAPGGVAVDDENLYVTTGTIFGPGAGAVVRIDSPDEDRGRGDDDD
jgi:sugar lactone lactonase YvrE